MFFSKINRIWWQITGVILFNLPLLPHLTFAWLPVPVLHCYSCPLAQGACPIGTIQYFLIIGAVPFFVIGVVGLFGIFAGRFYCSHLCPFGFFQDLLKRITSYNVRIPHFFEYGKYLVLIFFVLILPPLVKEPFFCTLCPAGTLEAGIPIVAEAWFKTHFGSSDPFSALSGILNMIGWWFWFKLGILMLVIACAFFIRRPFCRMACPLGAILGLFNRISLLVHPPGDKHAGTHHRYFLKNCPVSITHPQQVDSPSCIKCKECYKHDRQ